MAQNIEIKAKLSEQDFQTLEAKVAQLVERDSVLHQTDTFFNTPLDRLKLREFPDRKAELIAYQRTDQNEPKLSDYIRTTIDDSESLKLALTRSLGLRGVVKKRRDLYLVGQTRVHLDRVEDLGTFVELEVVLNTEQSMQQGNEVADDLMDRLGICNDWLVPSAYIDLLEQVVREV